MTVTFEIANVKVILLMGFSGVVSHLYSSVQNLPESDLWQGVRDIRLAFFWASLHALSGNEDG